MLSRSGQAVAGEGAPPQQRTRYLDEFDVPDEPLCGIEDEEPFCVDEDPEFEPVVELELLGSSVRIVMECGPMTIITGSPFLSLALTRNEPGTTCMFVNPSEDSFCWISRGTLCVFCCATEDVAEDPGDVVAVEDWLL
jgi:hypothetical protein